MSRIFGRDEKEARFRGSKISLDLLSQPIFDFRGLKISMDIDRGGDDRGGQLKGIENRFGYFTSPPMPVCMDLGFWP